MGFFAAQGEEGCVGRGRNPGFCVRRGECLVLIPGSSSDAESGCLLRHPTRKVGVWRNRLRTYRRGWQNRTGPVCGWPRENESMGKYREIMDERRCELLTAFFATPVPWTFLSLSRRPVAANGKCYCTTRPAALVGMTPTGLRNSSSRLPPLPIVNAAIWPLPPTFT